MVGVQGADIDELENLARTAGMKAQVLDVLLRTASREIQASARVWSGADAASFRHDWRNAHGRQLVRCANGLRDMATTIRRNANAQRDTSMAQGSGSLVGAGLPEFPAPPVAPSAGDGSAEHGSKGRNFFQDRWDDTQRGFWFEVADSADAIGYDNAARHMRHYLGNSGVALAVDVDEMLYDLPMFRGRVEQTLEFALKDEIAQQIQASYTGEPVTFEVTTDWANHYAYASESSDWFYGLGGYSYAVGAEVTVTPGPDGAPVVEVQYQTHVFDRYNWDEGKAVDIGPVPVDDSSLGHLHEVGKAKEFEVRGSSKPQTFSYDYAGPSGADAPTEPPPTVEGTGGGRNRTDPPTRNDDRSRRSGTRETDRAR